MKRKDPASVKMPKRVTFKQGPAGTRYVYLTVRAYRNARGQPTSDEAAIGKLAPDGISLIPNQRYFELFDADGHIYQKPESVLAFGDTAVLSVLAKQLKLTDVLNDTAGHLTPAVLLTAAYMVVQGNVMCHMDTFCQENWVPDGIRLDSPRVSELFEVLDFDIRAAFLRRWIALRQEDEYIAYDVTSFSTYSGGIEDAEWGYNRDEEDLCQINLGMFLGEETQLPLCYETYQGSIPDKARLSGMMATSQALGIKKARFVFDCGFVTKANLSYVNTEHLSFVSALSISRIEARALINQAASSIRSSQNRVNATGLYAKSYTVELEGLKVYAHIFFSPHKAAVEEEIVYARVNRLQCDLEKLDRDTKKIARRYRTYFDVTLKNGGVNFKRDFSKIDAELAQAGYFILITNDSTLDASGTLAVYRGKDIIEKAFSGMKNYLDFKRMRTHSTVTTDGKLFIGFIALILRSAIRRALSTCEETKNMSVGTALRELHKLKRITFPDTSAVYSTVSKTQRDILTALGIDVETLFKIG